MISGSARQPAALLRVAQMNEADRLTIAAGTPGIQLMSHAGSAVVREIVQRWRIRPVCVLCGPGNNGGDGFVVASELAAAGWPVRVALLGSMERLTGDAAHHAARWRGPVDAFGAAALADAGLVIDAVFGSGLSRPLGGDVIPALTAAAARRVPVVAIDVPSGVMGDTGESFGAIPAACTVTFTRKKPAHVLLPGRDLCGDVVVADIGTPPEVLAGIGVDAWENHPGLWRDEFPRPTTAGNKYGRGHALLFGGYPMTGAARMAARAAARAGAGLTSVAVPEAALPIYAAALTSIMVHPLSAPEDLSALLGTPRVSTLPQAHFSPDFSVIIEVQQFESIPGKSAEISAVWTVRKTSGGSAQSGFTCAKEPVSGDGFDALAAAHSRALATVSSAIAATIRTEADQH